MTDILAVVPKTIGLVLLVIFLTRIVGLRSFSKMSGFDFVITVAIGSVLGSAVTTTSTGVWIYVTAFVALFTTKELLAMLRLRFAALADTIDNRPLLIMENGTVLSDNLKKANMSENDLYAKLREANAIDLSLVCAAVFETTGEVSVLHKLKSGDAFHEELLHGVRR